MSSLPAGLGVEAFMDEHGRVYAAMAARQVTYVRYRVDSGETAEMTLKEWLELALEKGDFTATQENAIRKRLEHAR